MSLTRRHVVALSVVLALVLVVGVFFLVRLATSGPEPGPGAPVAAASGARPKVVVSVGDVRLDGTSPDQSCARIRVSGLSVPARVMGERLAGPPGMVADAAHCSALEGFAGGCPGKTLFPETYGCYVGAMMSGPEPAGVAKGTITLLLRVTCTSATGVPCGAAAVRAQNPSPAHPVDVELTPEGIGLRWPRGAADPPEESETPGRPPPVTVTPGGTVPPDPGGGYG